MLLNYTQSGIQKKVDTGFGIILFFLCFSSPSLVTTVKENPLPFCLDFCGFQWVEPMADAGADQYTFHLFSVGGTHGRCGC
jgi:hypothetical protein